MKAWSCRRQVLPTMYGRIFFGPSMHFHRSVHTIYVGSSAVCFSRILLRSLFFHSCELFPQSRNVCSGRVHKDLLFLLNRAIQPAEGELCYFNASEMFLVPCVCSASHSCGCRAVFTGVWASVAVARRTCLFFVSLLLCVATCRLFFSP